ncbi:hypothetical protein D9615_003293 [Tricholomella constricta]|uniref:Ribonuclease H1 N-terminal domain-containing protein n=1 Tax=Tricholomella constricta TaxID=117010 RepID=A0A8H5HJ94_9AGAR|nr:hypothetical protein D9615_003293 [Tricholomella constricta]
MDAGVPTGSPSSLTLSDLLCILTISGLDFTLTVGQPTTINDPAPGEPLPTVQSNPPTIVGSSHFAHTAFTTLPPGIAGLTITRAQSTAGASAVSPADVGSVAPSPVATVTPADAVPAVAVPTTAVPATPTVPATAVPATPTVPAIAVPATPTVSATATASSGATTVSGTAAILPIPTLAAAHAPTGNAVAAAPISLSPINVSDNEGEVVGLRWYTVTRGRRVGVFANWDTVAPLVVSVSGAVYARHASRAQAEGGDSLGLGQTYSCSLVYITPPPSSTAYVCHSLVTMLNM